MPVSIIFPPQRELPIRFNPEVYLSASAVCLSLLIADVGVARRGTDILVAEELLDFVNPFPRG